MQSKGSLLHHSIDFLKRHIPRSKRIDVDLKKNQFGKYITKVKVLTKGKIYWAKKIDDTPARSLAKATGAIVRQFEKVNKRKPHNRLDDYSLAS
jgi:hypothetical protein